MQAIISATCVPAEFFGIDGDLGTIQEGKIADMVLLDNNPLDDIKNTRSIAAVVCDGRLISKSEIREMLAACAVRAQQEKSKSKR